MSSPERAALSRRLEQLAAEALKSSRSEVTWEQDGRQYSARLIRERANEGTALERVTAQVSASDHGRQLTTLVNLNRLAFSQFTQMIDRWDPSVQLHDDEISGRFHTNSRFNLLADSRSAPKFLGKVTTTARSFNNESIGRRRDSDIFRGGIETGTSVIELPESSQPFQWAPRDEKARVHEVARDTRIRFFADGSYRWTDLSTSQSQYLNDPAKQPVYFIGTRGAALHVQGVVAGKVLLYSPRRIVIEGSLTYATDPRNDSGSEDYLGIVSDRVVEVAPPGVTGGGDLRSTRRFTRTALRRHQHRSFAHGDAAHLRQSAAARSPRPSRATRPRSTTTAARAAASDWLPVHQSLRSGELERGVDRTAGTSCRKLRRAARPAFVWPRSQIYQEELTQLSPCPAPNTIPQIGDRRGPTWNTFAYAGIRPRSIHRPRRARTDTDASDRRGRSPQ